MIKTLIPLLPFLCALAAEAQVDFSAFPRKLQLYARNAASDTGTVPVSGTVTGSGQGYTVLRVKVYRNNSLLKTWNQNLAFAGGTADFSVPIPIKAELAQYKFEAYGVSGSAETLLRSADSVVCGDIYIISGQSNAEAHSFAGSARANNSPYIRVFGYATSASDTTWRVGQGDGNQDTPGNTGQWGLRMARRIVDNHGIPVAIFNGCASGMAIDFFKRNNAAPENTAGNYGKLLTRLRKTGLAASAQALLWFQGEQDANLNTPLATYMNAFTTLRSDWLKDYPALAKIYLFQVGSTCNTSNQTAAEYVDHVNQVKEAQRRLGETVPGVQTLSSSGGEHFDDGGASCHFPFANGYEMFGNDAYRLLARDFYGKPADDIDAPAIRFAEVSGEREITLVLKNILDSLAWNTGSEKNFRIEGSAAQVSSGKTAWNRIVLTLSGAPAGATGISYLGNAGSHADPLVRNRNAIGALHFYKFPLTTARYRDSASVAAILKANGLAIPVDSVAAYSGPRITSLRLGARKLALLPPDIGYLDSLRTLDLKGNLLAALPREIARLPALASIDVAGNRLCAIADSLAGWIDIRATAAGWRATQTGDGIGSCAGTGMRRQDAGAPGPSEGLSMRMTPGFLHLEWPMAIPGRTVRIVRPNGTVAARQAVVSERADLDLRALGRGLYSLQVLATGRASSRMLLIP